MKKRRFSAIIDAEKMCESGCKYMHEIKCPNCGEVFQVDEAGYAEIVAQVRNEQFEKDVASQVKLVKEHQAERQEKLLMEAEGKYKLELAQKEQELSDVKHDLIALQMRTQNK